MFNIIKYNIDLMITGGQLMYIHVNPSQVCP